MRAAQKVVFNTGILYTKMVITIGVSLYSTRIVLNALGASDYGVFNLVAGVIAMLAFLNVAMTTSTQRYLSYHQANEEKDILKRIFSNSLLLHLVIGFIVVLALAVLGSFLFNGWLNIPVERIYAARSVYVFMSAAVFFTIISVPFNALLNSHENMITVAVIGLVEVLLKLIIAFLLLVLPGDLLVSFGFLTASVAVISFIMYAVYCFRKYPECTLSFSLSGDRGIRKELTSFAGWNLFGTLCGIGRIQGIAILLNIFFGAIANAAYAIANQVSGQLNFFSVTLLQALNPQIMKSEGALDRQRMLRLSTMASKFCFFLVSLFAIPAIFEMHSILAAWLKTVPVNTAIFCQLILVGILVNQLTVGLQSAIQATGNIKGYQAIVGSILLLNIPVAYILLSYGFPAYSALVSFSIIELIACAFRVYFLHKIAGLNVTGYMNMMAKIICAILPSVLFSYLIVVYADVPGRPVITISVSTISILAGIYFVGLNTGEKLIIVSVMKKIQEKMLLTLQKLNPAG